MAKVSVDFQRMQTTANSGIYVNIIFCILCTTAVVMATKYHTHKFSIHWSVRFVCLLICVIQSRFTNRISRRMAASMYHVKAISILQYDSLRTGTGFMLSHRYAEYVEPQRRNNGETILSLGLNNVC